MPWYADPAEHGAGRFSRHTLILLHPLKVCHMNSELAEGPSVIALGCWGNSFAGPTTSFLLEMGASRTLLDLGCDPIGRLQAMNIHPTSVDALYISHLHSDHSSGLANFLFTRGLLGRGHIPSPMKVKVFAHQSVLMGAREMVHIQYPERDLPVDWITIETGEAFSIGDGYNATIVPNLHTVPCFGLVVRYGAYCVAFTSDSAPSDLHRDVMADCDILIGEAFGLEAEVGSDIHRRGHSTAEDLAILAARTRCRLVVPFHFGQENSNLEKRLALLRACSVGHSAEVIDPVHNPKILFLPKNQ
jgi:ribonuclease Z